MQDASMSDEISIHTANGDVLVVDKETLLSSSDVFASMIDESPDSSKLHLSERTDHVKMMIDVLTTSIPSPPPAAQLWRIITIIPLLQKYELDQTLLQLKSTLRKAATDSSTPTIFVFLAAARLSSMDICTTCIRNGGRETWKEVLDRVDEDVEDEVGIERDMRELGCFDIRSWSEGVSVKVPAEVLSRLWKAQIGLDLDMEKSEVEGVWEKVAQRFKIG